MNVRCWLGRHSWVRVSSSRLSTLEAVSVTEECSRCCIRRGRVERITR